MLRSRLRQGSSSRLVPGLSFVLDTTYGEVAFAPTFMSLAHLVSFLDAAKTAATKLWIKERHAGRLRWRRSVEASALALAAAAAHNPASLLTGGSSGGGFAAGGGRSAAAAAAAAAAQEESDEDEDGMGDPPEAKALLEELGEGPGSSQRGAAARSGMNGSGFGGAGGAGSFTVPSTKGVMGALNAVALGTISMAAAGCCGAQELLDRAALAVPAVGEWVIGLPGSVNVQAAFLEDLAAAAAEHNRGRLQPPYTVIAPAGSSSGASSSNAGQSGEAAAASGAAAALYDPLGLVTAEPTAAAQQQQQQLAPLPPLELPCLDGLRLMLAAGWGLAADVLLRDGALAGAVLGGPGGLAQRLQGASIQVSDEGEVALRLGLTVTAAPVPYSSHLPQPYGSSSSTNPSQLQQQQQQAEAHVFELGVHLNLSQLIGVPSLQHADQLHAERGGPGHAARGVLLIGDLGLNQQALAEMPWRAPSLGLGLLPVAPLDCQQQQQQQVEQGEEVVKEAGRAATGQGRSRSRGTASRGAAGGSSSSSTGSK
ncbi:hypothetical protein OEZ86_001296 [Tetradesmus obliquus]|nr:hypothetical protein OEZ86_001296 [Tetradesmus obliquus]